MTASTETSTKSYSEQILDLYELGGSDAEVAALLRVPIKKFHQRMRDSSAFAELIEFGRTLSLAYWEGLARKNVGNKQFNSPLFAFYMKNRHGWADKIDTNNTNESTIFNLDEAREQVAVLMAEHLAANTPEDTAAKRVLETSK